MKLVRNWFIERFVITPAANGRGVSADAVIKFSHNINSLVIVLSSIPSI